MFKILSSLLRCVRGRKKEFRIPNEVLTVGPEGGDSVVDEIEESPASDTIVPQITTECCAAGGAVEGIAVIREVAAPGISTVTREGHVKHKTSVVTAEKGTPVGSTEISVAQQQPLRDPENNAGAGGYPEAPGGSSGRRGSGGINNSRFLGNSSRHTTRKEMGATSSADKYPKDIQKASPGQVSELENSMNTLHTVWNERCAKLLQQSQERYDDVYKQQIRQWEFLVVYTREDEVKGEHIRSLLRTYHKIETPDPFCLPGQNILDYHEKNVASFIYVIILVSKALLNDNEMKCVLISELLAQENRNIFPLYLERDLDFPCKIISEIEERHIIGPLDNWFYQEVLKAKRLRYKNEIERIDNMV